MKLERGNDWGTEYFAFPGCAKNAYGTCSVSYGITPFEEGATIRVRWPNTLVSFETISKKAFHTTVSDHGSENHVNYELDGIMSDCHGVPQWVPLDAVEVWIQTWGVKLASYKQENSSEFQHLNMWIYDAKGRFETTKFEEATKVKADYQNRNPGGIYMIQEIKEETNV